MTVWGSLLSMGIGAALGGVTVWFECCAGDERRARMAADGYLRVTNLHPHSAPRSNCRRLDGES